MADSSGNAGSSNSPVPGHRKSGVSGQQSELEPAAYTGQLGRALAKGVSGCVVLGRGLSIHDPFIRMPPSTGGRREILKSCNVPQFRCKQARSVGTKLDGQLLSWNLQLGGQCGAEKGRAHRALGFDPIASSVIFPLRSSSAVCRGGKRRHAWLPIALKIPKRSSWNA